MKQFHVYGIGNALVDIDFEVCNATLERLNIAKGVMTLIDEDTHHRLLEELDGIKHLKTSGGSAANTVYTMQQLGANTFYSCKVGNDPSGDFFCEELKKQGVHTNLNELPRDGVTGKCIVLVTPDADRTMNTFLGATSKFSKAQLSEDAIKNSEYLYIEGYLVPSPTGREAAVIARHMARKHNVKIAISLSDPNMVTYFKDGFEEIIDTPVDILFCNEHEALLYTKSKDLITAQEMLKQHAKTFVITRGEEGSLIYDGENFVNVPAYKVKVVDTVGAGDIFAGTFLYAITHGYSYVKAGDLANYAASKIVTKFGARLSQTAIDEILANISQQAVCA